ncbi:hypothetical protein ESCO_001191 [Escovopsis weberi]|uniref:Homeobox domain-containing protein n=1 Tax=Escovopsis weberi TaxID=150374 RepID=A0A0M9VTJ8_ESCWE|nr:hypothetical protein ESCO_001191 [Escovopsis weberi]
MRSRSATHDISRTAFHVKHIGQFARRLEDSAARAFPNRGRTSQRYKNVQVLLLHWASDDLFVLPELEDLEKCLRDHYAFGTDIFAIPSENSHLELMMRIGQLLQGHESQDTLFIIYYGGHARIDESRQSTWCASDVLILLDCCAGAASATFPAGDSITETISASSWNAIAPDPGRYSFTNALIEILQEWQMRAFSAAMLHAELLARLKHPRPVAINGKLFEARSTPVHFMMTSNHRVPSIELSRLAPREAFPKDKRPPVPPRLTGFVPGAGREAGAPVTRQQEASPFGAPPSADGPILKEPTEDVPHVMISLALEGDQRLDMHAWEQWLNAFPALAKYVKIQGVFKSHSTLMLVSLPVMIWDLLPEDPATSFVAFIRSNNMAPQIFQQGPEPIPAPTPTPTPASASAPARRAETALVPDTASLTSGFSGTTLAATETGGRSMQHVGPHHVFSPGFTPPSYLTAAPSRHRPPSAQSPQLISMQAIPNKQQSQRRTTFGADVPPPKNFAAHVEKRLEEYYHLQPLPNDSESAFIASNLGIEPLHLEVWFHHRRQRDAAAVGPSTTAIKAQAAMEILPPDLDQLLEISPPGHSLILDTRSPSEFEKSLISGAINMRVPLSFLGSATPDMVEQSFADKQSRHVFAGWREARCIVVYSGGPESAQHCAPVATALWHNLLQDGWKGKVFVLKTSYEDFSSMFDGRTARGKAAAAASSPRPMIDHGTTAMAEEGMNQFEEWLAGLENKAQAGDMPFSHDHGHDHDHDHDQQQQREHELELEFRSRCPDLHYRAQQDSFPQVPYGRDSPEFKAQLVESLDRGLSKIRSHALSEPAPLSLAPHGSKWAGMGMGMGMGASGGHDEMEEYVEIDKVRADEVTASAGSVSSVSSGKASGEEAPRRGFNLLDKMLRRS